MRSTNIPAAPSGASRQTQLPGAATAIFPSIFLTSNGAAVGRLHPITT